MTYIAIRHPKAGMAQEVRRFAEAWFRTLGAAPVEQLLPYLKLPTFTFYLPDPTAICDETGFREWYASFNTKYPGQRHEILSLEAGGAEQRPIVHIHARVHGHNQKTGEPFSYIVKDELWLLHRGGEHGFQIEAYVVPG